ncbi:hypothetical protein LEMLEM_LOCUS22970, partial [Lemmus lemmus]
QDCLVTYFSTSYSRLAPQQLLWPGTMALVCHRGNPRQEFKQGRNLKAGIETDIMTTEEY